MAGLLLKELKIRGLVKRTLIVTPANLTFQWQRELKDKFREKFEVIRSDVLRANYGQNPWQEKNQVITSDLLGLAHRGCPGEPAPQPLGSHHRRRGPQDERLQRGQEDARLPARRVALGDDRPLPADDGDAAQGRPGELLPVPLPARPGRLRRREEPRGGHAAARGAVLSAPAKEALVTLPRPGDRARSRSSSRSATSQTVDFRARRRRARLLRRADPLRRGPVDQGRGRRLAPAAAPSASRWRCSSAASPPASTPCAAASSGCGRSGRRSWTIPRRTARSRSSKRLPDDFDDLTEEEQQEIIAELEDVVVVRRSRPLCATRSPSLDKLIDQATTPREARGRVEAQQAARGPHRAGHLRRPEDEAADLHRAQGHARLPRRRRQGRPSAREAPRVGPVRHADPRRHEDRRPRHARHPHLRRAGVPRGLPGPGRHRGGRRRHQPPVLLVDGQLRHPVEPRPARTADGPHPPLRPGAGLPDLQLRRARTPARAASSRSSSTASRRSGRNWAPTRSSTSSARSSRRTCLEKLFRDMYAQRIDGDRASRTASSRTSTRDASARSPNRRSRDWRRRN